MAQNRPNCLSSGGLCCASSTSHACSRPDRSGLFLALGLAGGLVGGLALARKLFNESPSELKASKIGIWQRELAKSRGTVAAGFLCAQIQERYADLYQSRPRFSNAVLRRHLEDNILPGLALYQVLRSELPDTQQALADLDRLFEAEVQFLPLERGVRLLGSLPDPFAAFRRIHNLSLDKQFPPEGWRFEWVEDSPNVIAYNCTDCFYHNILTRYNASELTEHFCRVDDVMFGGLPYLDWKRTTTIGRGDASCNFRFEKRLAAEKK